MDFKVRGLTMDEIGKVFSKGRIVAFVRLDLDVDKDTNKLLSQHTGISDIATCACLYNMNQGDVVMYDVEFDTMEEAMQYIKKLTKWKDSGMLWASLYNDGKFVCDNFGDKEDEK